jgi:hypothetical protein
MATSSGEDHLVGGSTRDERAVLRRRLRRAGYRLLFVMMLVALVVGFQVLQVGNTTGSGAPSPEDVLSAAGFYPEALKKAQDWRSDAFLTWLIVDVRPTKRIAYSFDSASDPNSGFLVYVRQGLGAPLLTTQEVQSNAQTHVDPPLERDEWPLDSQDVFSVALENGAAEFLHQNADSQDWFLQLPSPRRAMEGEVTWRVSLGDLFGDTLEMIIDPVTGEVKEAGIDKAYAPTLVPVGQGEVRVPSARSFYPQMLEIARSWRPDAYLSGPRIGFKLAADPEPWSIRFSAYSPSDPSAWLEIELREDALEAIISERPCPDGGCRPGEAYAPDVIDSGEAVALALEAGGRDFLLRRKQGDFGLSVVQGATFDAPLVWSVSLMDESELPATTLLLVIDPVTGEVIRSIRAP